LIDTGAHCSAIDTSIIQLLALTPKSPMLIHTPSTDGTAKERNTYDAGHHALSRDRTSDISGAFCNRRKL
jgi:hypothetical protein